MQVNRVTGEIAWLVNSKTRAKHKSKMLTNKNIELFAYIEMYDREDELQLQSYQLL